MNNNEFKFENYSLKNIKELYSQLEDELSKKIFLARVNYNIDVLDENFLYEFNASSVDFKSLLGEDKNINIYNLDKVFPKTFDVNKKTVFYGIGGYFNQYYEKFTQEIKNFVLCDKNYENIIAYADNKLISPNELFENYQDTQVIITVVDNIQVLYNYLLENGIKEENIFTIMQVYPDIKFDYYDVELIKEYRKNNLSNCIDIDLNNIIVHPHSYVQNQYFDKDIIKWEDEEIFVDCGSFDGMTSVYFSRFCNSNGKKTIILEPNSKQFDIIKNNVLLKSSSLHFESFNLGAWSKFDTLKFFSNSTGGAISLNGTLEIEVDKLDNIIKEKVTFIKMDIEGAEINALIGAKETIKNTNLN